MKQPSLLLGLLIRSRFHFLHHLIMFKAYCHHWSLHEAHYHLSLFLIGLLVISFFTCSWSGFFACLCVQNLHMCMCLCVQVRVYESQGLMLTIFFSYGLLINYCTNIKQGLPPKPKTDDSTSIACTGPLPFLSLRDYRSSARVWGYELWSSSLTSKHFTH